MLEEGKLPVEVVKEFDSSGRVDVRVEPLISPVVDVSETPVIVGTPDIDINEEVFVTDNDPGVDEIDSPPGPRVEETKTE